MKRLFLSGFLLLTAFFGIGCEKSGLINVRNSVSGATIQNVRWGDVLLSNQLLPGERSSTLRIYDDPDWGVDLPAEEPLRFYLNVGGDLIFLETRATYRLDEDQKVELTIDDTTAVWNSVVAD